MPIKKERIKDAKALLQYVLENPEEHDQTTYGERTECGTTACLAGTYILQNRRRFPEIRWHIFSRASLEEDSEQEFLDLLMSESSRNPVDKQVAEDLGLTPREAKDLFLNLNNDEAIDYLVELIEQAENSYDES